MAAGSTWTNSPTFDYNANADGEIMLINEAIFDASGSWRNWLPCDQVPTLRNEPVSIAAPYLASASRRELASSQRPQGPQGPQAAQSQASHIPSPTRTSDIRGLEPAQLEKSTRTCLQCQSWIDIIFVHVLHSQVLNGISMLQVLGREAHGSIGLDDQDGNLLSPLMHR